MNFEDCKDIKDYMAFCNVKSIDELSDEQVLMWAKSGKMGLKTKVSAGIVELGMLGKKPNREKAIQLLKQAITENKTFTCSYIIRESCDGSINVKDDNEYFKMIVK